MSKGWAVLEWGLSIVIVLGGFAAINMIAGVARKHARSVSVTDDGQTVLRDAVDASVRFEVDAKVSGGLRPQVSYRSKGHLRLTTDTILLATNHGRILEITAAHPWVVRTPGPRMMILEGPHPSGRARVRAELIVDNEQDWKSDIEAHLSSPS